MNGESERSKSAVLLAGVDAPNDGGDESGPEPRDARRLLQLQLSYVRVGSSGRRKHDEEDGGGSRPESEDRLIIAREPGGGACDGIQGGIEEGMQISDIARRCYGVGKD